MRRALPLLALLLVPGSVANAQDDTPEELELDVPPPPGSQTPPPPTPPPAQGLTPPTAQATPPAPAPVAPATPVTPETIAPLVDAAEADLAAQRYDLAMQRAALVMELLPEGAALRIRAEGLWLVAQQRGGTQGERPLEQVLAPLMAAADADLRAGNPQMARARLELVLARLPTSSGLRPRALEMHLAATQGASAPQPYPAPQPAPYGAQPYGTQPQYGGQGYGTPYPQNGAVPGGGYYAAQPRPPEPPPDPSRRGTAEMVELYITGGLFGLLTGAYIPFAASDDTAEPVTYILTMTGGAAVMVISALLLDLADTIETGTAPMISAGIRLGFANGMLAMALGVATDGGIEPSDAFGLVWGGAAIGLATGVGVGFGLRPSVDQVRFIESAALWGGGVGTSIALITEYEDDVVGIGLSLGGLNLGMITGAIMAAADFVPSAGQTLIMDAAFLGGAGLLAGLTAAGYDLANEPPEAIGFGVAMLVGGLTGWALAFGLVEKARQDGAARLDAPSVHLALSPVEGGATVSAFGDF